MRLLMALALVAACHQDVPRARALTPAPPVTYTARDVALPPPPVVVTVMTPGAFEIENTTRAPVKLATEARIERDGAPLDAVDDYRLVEDCSAKPDACVEIPAGATLRPVPWTGFSCSSQCNQNCDKNVWMGGAASFRFAVKTCDGARTIRTPAFTMPRDPRPNQLARQSFTSDVASATVARLELPTQQFALGAPATPDHIAGFAVTPGTEKSIDKTLADAFVQLVQDENGFDDKIAKRCLMSDLVGVRLVRHPPTTGPVKEDVVEIAFDQTCSKFFAVRGDSSHRVEMATHYDPQRRAFLAWAKRVLTPP